MQVDPKNPAHPITLPFMNPHSFKKLLEDPNLMDVSVPDASSNNGIGGAAATARKPAAEPTASKLGPADILFKSQRGDYSGEDQIFFVQLPTSLPTRVAELPAVASVPASAPGISGKDEMDVDEVKDDAAQGQPAAQVRAPTKPGEVDDILGFRSTLAGLPSGFLGKLRVYKSGKVRMVLGDVEYDVSTGMTCNFLQEAIAVDNGHLYQLGEISKRMVCFPVVQELLQPAVETVVLDS